MLNKKQIDLLRLVPADGTPYTALLASLNKPDKKLAQDLVEGGILQLNYPEQDTVSPSASGHGVLEQLELVAFIGDGFDLDTLDDDDPKDAARRTQIARYCRGGVLRESGGRCTLGPDGARLRKRETGEDVDPPKPKPDHRDDGLLDDDPEEEDTP